MSAKQNTSKTNVDVATTEEPTLNEELTLQENVTTVVEALSLRPDEWAVKKGLLKVHRDGSTDYRVTIPWQFNVMRGLAKWPDPNADPTFKITEEAFNKVFDRAKEY